MRHLVIIPTYNEIENVAAIISAVLAHDNYQVLIVDDDSPDGTGNLVDAMISSDKDSNRIHLLRRKGKLGLGTAYIAGFKYALEAGFDLIYEMDADFSHDPLDLPRLSAPIVEGQADVVVGSRYVKGGGVQDWGKDRIFISRGGSLYVRLITAMPILDPTAGFICYSRQALRAINLDRIGLTGYGFQIEMKYVLYKLNFRIKEVPIVFKDRVLGISKMNIGIIKEAIRGVIMLRLRNIRQYYLA